MAEKDPEQEENIDEADEREQMVDDAEIEPQEGAFVEGYEKDEAESMKKKKKKQQSPFYIGEYTVYIYYALLTT